MQKQKHVRDLAAAAALLVLPGTALLGACDELISGLEPLVAVTQAVVADDAAASEEVDDTADESGDVADTDDVRGHDGPCDGRMPPEGGPRGEGPGGEEDSVVVAACVPPVKDGVDLGRGPPRRDHLAALYDEDESGDLSDEEAAALVDDAAAGCVARNAAALDEFDADDDGLLDQDEFDAARAARRAERDAFRAALDTDGDGEVSRAEHDAARADLIAAWDVDGDGDLNADERGVMREDLQQLVRDGEPLPPLPIHGAHHGGGHRPPPDGDDDDGDAPLED